MSYSDNIAKAIAAADAALEKSFSSAGNEGDRKKKERYKTDATNYLNASREKLGLPSIKQRLSQSPGGMKTIRVILDELDFDKTKKAPHTVQKYIINFGMHLAELDDNFKKLWGPVVKSHIRLKLISLRVPVVDSPSPGRS